MWLPYYMQFLVYSVAVNVFLFFTIVIYYKDLLLSRFDNKLLPEYDFIIVGAGTAGSLIAHRIASETNFTFVVLEAGGRSNPFYEVPVFGPLLQGSMYDWMYETTPQEHACFAMVDRKCKLAQGKIVGGSSKLNNMIHLKGNTSQYSEWFHGKYGIEFFEKHLNYIEEEIFYVNELKYESELADAVLDAAKALGYEIIGNDFKIGFLKNIITQKNGKRWTTSDKLDVNKHVITNALVEKVLVNDGQTYGVNVYISNSRYTVFARKGVILAAGTLNTPKILQLSGIGPSKLLESLDIPLIQDLPVGLNLQDHIGTGLDLILLNKSLSISTENVLNPFNLFHYIQGEGPWTYPGSEVSGFISTKNLTSPDIQIMILPVGIASDKGSLLRKRLGITDEAWNGYFTKIFDKHASTFCTIILHPKSRGSVYIKSRDAKIPPLINAGYLSEKEDVDTLISGLKLAIKLLKTDSLKSIKAYLNTNHFPGCGDHKFFSDKYLECYIRSLTLSSYHPVGTCSMGLPELKNTVVDTSFRVLNVKNLYVADGSVLPTLPGVNINAAIAMMANIFFETNIKNLPTKNKVKYCDKYDKINQYLFKICN
ncbi:glucose dehydrogenase [FAD, quinone]-like [Battus philenor]|uniref:glucose dehydrogenase [FAD, quinone]-like n=1 Tax=Battus philenor TaxID=42288 RepID=UPI0035CF9D1D